MAAQSSELELELQRERDRADRLERLQRASSTFTAARTEEELSDALMGVTEVLLHWCAAVVYLEDPAGNFRLRAWRGVEPRIERWGVIEREHPNPLSAALRKGAPVLIGSRQALMAEYPDLAVSDLAPSRLQAIAALPLVHGGRVLGGMAVSFDQEREFDEDERRWIEGIASHAALAVDRAAPL